jgi:hypothetical protein
LLPFAAAVLMGILNNNRDWWTFSILESRVWVFLRELGSNRC